MKKRQQALCDRIDYTFSDPTLLAEALTHPSVSSADRHYERLEFLGDRVLGLIIADELYRRYPQAREGDMARRLSALVRRESLSMVAEKLQLDRCVDVAASERDGPMNKAILANACEALIGAIYLDGGLEAARAFVLRYWREMLVGMVSAPKDAKSSLQEWAHRQGHGAPVYKVIAQDGPPHQPVFTIEVTVSGIGSARARGKSKRMGEQDAAARLLKEYRQDGAD